MLGSGSQSSPPPLPTGLPQRILYSTSARIGGSGLDQVADQSLQVAVRNGLLCKAVAYGLHSSAIPAHLVDSLRWAPVRMASSFLNTQQYYAAKKRWVDRHTARLLESASCDLFHSWSGDCLRSLRVARKKGIPALLEIPTWHRHKGARKSAAPDRKERERLAASGWKAWKERLLISRQETLEEYDLASLILVLSEKAEETFLAAGVPKEKLFRHQRGVDPVRFSPAPNPPEIFRVLFVGSLCLRKGVHVLLEAWHRLALKNAELVLVGSVQPEIEPYLKQFAGSTVKLAGFVQDVAQQYQTAALHAFPSSCEGSAKCTYEAAACGLPQITTREAGDVVQHGESGWIIPPENPAALAEALSALHQDRRLAQRMGHNARRRVEERFTWTHFGQRLLEAYAAAFQMSSR
jgi:glycosyltransferase involved in cell wall biosynthesis